MAFSVLLTFSSFEVSQKCYVLAEKERYTTDTALQDEGSRRKIITLPIFKGDIQSMDTFVL